MCTDPVLSLSLKLYQPGEQYLPLTCDLKPALCQLCTDVGLFMAESNRQLSGGARSWGALGLLLICLRLINGVHWPCYTSCSFPHSPRPKTGSQQPWIALWLLTGIPQGHSWAVSDIDLHWRDLRINIPSGWFETSSECD